MQMIHKHTHVHRERGRLALATGRGRAATGRACARFLCPALFVFENYESKPD